MNQRNVEAWAMTAPIQDVLQLQDRLALIVKTRTVPVVEAPAPKKKAGRPKGSRKRGLPVNAAVESLTTPLQ